MKEQGEKISMLTAYDFSMARILDAAGIDILLVGDSASNVMAGHETTLPITLDQMIYHAASVVRASKRSLVVVDMPFGSYQGNSKEALNSAIRIMKETGGHSIKLEGGEEALAGAHANHEALTKSLAKKIIDGADYLKIAPTLVHCARDVALPNMSTALPKKPSDLSQIYQMKEEYGLGASVDRLIAALGW